MAIWQSFWLNGTGEWVPPTPKAASDTLTVFANDVLDLAKADYERIAPDAIVTQTNLTGAVADITDDPDSPDANWLVGGGAVVLQVTFPSPSADLMTGAGLQEFRVRVRPGT